MNDRKLIRPDLEDIKRSPASRGARRRAAPPEQTNAEEFYYLKQMAAKTPIVMILTDGEELHGWIEWYDKGSIKLTEPKVPISSSSSTTSATCSRKRSSGEGRGEG